METQTDDVKVLHLDRVTRCAIRSRTRHLNADSFKGKQGVMNVQYTYVP